MAGNKRSTIILIFMPMPTPTAPVALLSRYFMAVIITCLVSIAPAAATVPEYQTYEQSVPGSVLELDGTFGELQDADNQRREHAARRRALLKDIFWNSASLVLPAHLLPEPATRGQPGQRGLGRRWRPELSHGEL